jgi:hypothetical protein
MYPVHRADGADVVLEQLALCVCYAMAVDAEQVTVVQSKAVLRAAKSSSTQLSAVRADIVLLLLHLLVPLWLLDSALVRLAEELWVRRRGAGMDLTGRLRLLLLSLQALAVHLPLVLLLCSLLVHGRGRRILQPSSSRRLCVQPEALRLLTRRQRSRRGTHRDDSGAGQSALVVVVSCTAMCIWPKLGNALPIALREKRERRQLGRARDSRHHSERRGAEGAAAREQTNAEQQRAPRREVET